MKPEGKMRRRVGLLLVLCLGMGLATAVAQKAKDATEVTPDTHRVAWENANVRVIEIRAVSGQKIPLHSHPANVVAVLSPARVKFTSTDGKTSLVELRPGDALWSDGGDHSAEVLAGTVHLIMVEVKGAKPAARP